MAGNGAPDADAALQDFDGISYAKGAAVLKQLVAHLGDEVFLAGLRDYFATHAYGNAALADLLAAWQRAGARDLDGWARDWLQTAGLDTLVGRGVGIGARAAAGCPRRVERPACARHRRGRAGPSGTGAGPAADHA